MIFGNKKSHKLSIILGLMALIAAVILAVCSGSSDTQSPGKPGTESGEAVTPSEGNGNETEQQTAAQSDAAPELTQTFTSEIAGISFRYPADWTALEPSGVQVVHFISEKNTANEKLSMTVMDAMGDDPFGVLTADDASVEQAVNEVNTFKELREYTAGGATVRVVTYLSSMVSGEVVKSFWYPMGGTIYNVHYNYSESLADTCEPLFDAIMDSCTISASSVSATIEPIAPSADPAGMLSVEEATQLIVAWLDDGHDMGYWQGPEYVGETTMYSGDPEMYSFNVYVSHGAYVPMLVDKKTGEIWADLDEETVPIDTYYEWFYGGGDDYYEPESDFSVFDRTAYQANMSYADMLRYADSNYGTKVYMATYQVDSVPENRVYICKKDPLSFSAAGDNWIVVDDRSGTGVSAMKGDRVSIYGSCAGTTTINFTNGTSQMAPVVLADWFINNNTPPEDTADFLSEMCKQLNQNQYAYGYNNYSSGNTITLDVGMYYSAARESFTFSVQNADERNSYTMATKLGTVDGYDVLIELKPMNGYSIPDDVRDQIAASDYVPKYTPVEITGNVTNIGQNEIGSYILKVTVEFNGITILR